MSIPSGQEKLELSFVEFTKIPYRFDDWPKPRRTDSYRDKGHDQNYFLVYWLEGWLFLPEIF